MVTVSIMFEFLAVAVQNTLGTGISNIAAHIGEILAIIAALSYAISGHMKAGKARDEVVAVGQFSTAMGQKAVENQGLIKTVADIAANDVSLTPEQKAKAQALIDELDQIVIIGKEQLTQLKANIPPAANADKIIDLPRENPRARTGHGKGDPHPPV